MVFRKQILLINEYTFIAFVVVKQRCYKERNYCLTKSLIKTQCVRLQMQYFLLHFLWNLYNYKRSRRIELHWVNNIMWNFNVIELIMLTVKSGNFVTLSSERLTRIYKSEIRIMQIACHVTARTKWKKKTMNFKKEIIN